MDEYVINLSLVVPVYNVAPYLPDLLQSLVNQQTQYTFEVIFVDDGSTDNGIEILRAAAEAFVDIHLIEQENQGPGIARNTGLAQVKGEYVAFIDGDDWLELDYVEKVVGHGKANNADIVVYDARKVNQDGQKYLSAATLFGSLGGEYLTGKDYFEANVQANRFFVGAWKYATKVTYIRAQQLQFPATMLSEDDYFTFFNYYLAQKVVVLPDVLYNYRIRQNSIIRSFTDKKKKDIKWQHHFNALAIMLAKINALDITMTPTIETYLIRNMLTNLVSSTDIAQKSASYQQVWTLISSYVDDTKQWFEKLDDTLSKAAVIVSDEERVLIEKIQANEANNYLFGKDNNIDYGSGFVDAKMITSVAMFKNFIAAKQGFLQSNDIFIFKGGTIGDEMLDSVAIWQLAFKFFKNNKIIILPQNLTFKPESTNFFWISKYAEETSDLTLYLTNQTSFDFAKKYLPPNVKLILTDEVDEQIILAQALEYDQLIAGE